MLSYLKLLRYLQLSPRLSQLSATISHAAADLSGFFLIFITVFFAYAQVCAHRLVCAKRLLLEQRSQLL